MPHIINILQGEQKMSQIHKHTIPANIADRCLINLSSTRRCINNLLTHQIPSGETGKNSRLDHTVPEGEKHLLAPGNVSIKWYEDGTLNLAANALTAICKKTAIVPPSSGKARRQPEQTY